MKYKVENLSPFSSIEIEVFEYFELRNIKVFIKEMFAYNKDNLEASVVSLLIKQGEVHIITKENYFGKFTKKKYPIIYLPKFQCEVHNYINKKLIYRVEQELIYNNSDNTYNNSGDTFESRRVLYKCKIHWNRVIVKLID